LAVKKEDRDWIAEEKLKAENGTVQRRMKLRTYLASLLCVSIVIPVMLQAADKQPAAAVELTDQGKKIEAQYAGMFEALKTELTQQLPAIDQARVAIWLEAIKAEEGPAKDAAAKAGAVAKMQAAEGRLRQLEENLKLGPKTVEGAKEELLRAKARGEENPEKEKELASAEKFLASRQKEFDAIPAEIEKAKVAVNEAKAGLPAAIKAAEEAKQAYEKAMAATWKAMDELGMGGILGSDKLDGKLAQYMVIHEATPRGLAEFAQKNPENEKLIQQLLDNKELQIQMLVADGPESKKYGEAMKIYTDIQKASPRAKEGLFQRLAVALSLGHAVPVRMWKASTDPEPIGKDTVFIDPVQRYLNYEKWYLAGEFQPDFKDLDIWNLVMVVDSPNPDTALAWAREMLHTFRPDCIPDANDTSLYVDVVGKELYYNSSMVKEDRPDLAVMQNILANGGICGRRGFFGRFIMQAFGVPAVERVEPGHSTIAHWHPDGWQTKLGGGWGPSSRGYYAWFYGRPRPYGADVNLLTSSQAREDATAFMRVKRAQWIGTLVGEERKPGLITYSGKTTGPAPKKAGEIEKPTFWTDLALHEQRRIIARLKSGKEASSSTPSVAAKAPAATGKITVDDKGVITIPSAACSSPAESTAFLYHGGQSELIVFLKNKSGDTLLHLTRYCKVDDTFEYTFDAPKAGKYQLLASVATAKWDQRLVASVNGGTPVEMPLPYTIGLWGKSAPVEVELAAGKNVLKFHGPARVTIGQFILTPVK
jgi:chemotaxis protein histidine kinase CheA